MSPLPLKTNIWPQENTPPKKYRRHFLWGTEDKVYKTPFKTDTIRPIVYWQVEEFKIPWPFIPGKEPAYSTFLYSPALYTPLLSCPLIFTLLLSYTLLYSTLYPSIHLSYTLLYFILLYYTLLTLYSSPLPYLNILFYYLNKCLGTLLFFSTQPYCTLLYTHLLSSIQCDM